MQPSAQSPLRALQRIFINITAAKVMFAVLLLLILPFAWKPEPLFAISAALSVASFVVVPLVGGLRPLPVGTPPAEAGPAGTAAFRRRLFLRFGISDSAALFGLAISFVLGTAAPYLLSAVIAVAVMVLFVIPTRQRVLAAEERLNSDGASSQLSAALGV